MSNLNYEKNKLQTEEEIIQKELDEREKQVKNLHKRIINYKLDDHDQNTLMKQKKELQYIVENRYLSLIRYISSMPNQQYVFPKTEFSSAQSSVIGSLKNSIYNLFEQNNDGKPCDEILYPNLKISNFETIVSQKKTCSTESGEVSKKVQNFMKKQKIFKDQPSNNLTKLYKKQITKEKEKSLQRIKKRQLEIDQRLKKFELMLDKTQTDNSKNNINKNLTLMFDKGALTKNNQHDVQYPKSNRQSQIKKFKFTKFDQRNNRIRTQYNQKFSFSKQKYRKTPDYIRTSPKNGFIRNQQSKHEKKTSKSNSGLKNKLQIDLNKINYVEDIIKNDSVKQQSKEKYKYKNDIRIKQKSKQQKSKQNKQQSYKHSIQKSIKEQNKNKEKLSRQVTKKLLQKALNLNSSKTYINNEVLKRLNIMSDKNKAQKEKHMFEQNYQISSTKNEQNQLVKTYQYGQLKGYFKNFKKDKKNFSKKKFKTYELSNQIRIVNRDIRTQEKLRSTTNNQSNLQNGWINSKSKLEQKKNITPTQSKHIFIKNDSKICELSSKMKKKK